MHAFYPENQPPQEIPELFTNEERARLRAALPLEAQFSTATAMSAMDKMSEKQVRQYAKDLFLSFSWHDYQTKQLFIRMSIGE